MKKAKLLNKLGNSSFHHMNARFKINDCKYNQISLLNIITQRIKESIISQKPENQS